MIRDQMAQRRMAVRLPQKVAAQRDHQRNLRRARTSGERQQLVYKAAAFVQIVAERVKLFELINHAEQAGVPVFGANAFQIEPQIAGIEVRRHFVDFDAPVNFAFLRL